MSPSVIQVTNVAAASTIEQMNTLFAHCGKIDEIVLYPKDESVLQSHAKTCYVRYADSWSVPVAQHLTNTVFIDRPLIVHPMFDDRIPDETTAHSLTGTVTGGSNEGVVNQVVTGVGGQQAISTIDPRLVALGLPQYPSLPANIDPNKIEEIRRTVLASNLDAQVKGEDILQFFNQIGEVKYVRLMNEEHIPGKSALVEFTEQSSVASALQHNGTMLGNSSVKITHANQAIIKPMGARTSHTQQKDIEETMRRVREAQSLITNSLEAPTVPGAIKLENILGLTDQNRQSVAAAVAAAAAAAAAVNVGSGNGHLSSGNGGVGVGNGGASGRRSRSRSKRRSRSRSPSRRRSRSRERGSSRRYRERSRSRDRIRGRNSRSPPLPLLPPPSSSSSSRRRSRTKSPPRLKRSRSRDRIRRDRSRSRSKERRTTTTRYREDSRHRRRSRSRDRVDRRDRERERELRERDRLREKDRLRDSARDDSRRRSSPPSSSSRSLETDRRRDRYESRTEEGPKLSRTISRDHQETYSRDAGDYGVEVSPTKRSRHESDVKIDSIDKSRSKGRSAIRAADFSDTDSSAGEEVRFPLAPKRVAGRDGSSSDISN